MTVATGIRLSSGEGAVIVTALDEPVGNAAATIVDGDALVGVRIGAELCGDTSRAAIIAPSTSAEPAIPLRHAVVRRAAPIKPSKGCPGYRTGALAGKQSSPAGPPSASVGVMFSASDHYTRFRGR